MKRVLLSMLAIFTLSLMSFTTPNESVSLDSELVINETVNNNYTVETVLVSASYDHCTMTVTVTTPAGTASATATDNTGDCDAAAFEAEAIARFKLLIEIFE